MPGLHLSSARRGRNPADKQIATEPPRGPPFLPACRVLCGPGRDRPGQAAGGARTRDLHHGKVALYQLSYNRAMRTAGLEPATSGVSSRRSTN